MNNLFSSSWKRAGAGGDGGDLESGGVEMTAPPGAAAGASLDRFFEDVESIKDDLRELERIQRSLHDGNESGKSLHDASAVRALRSRMDADVAAAIKKAKVVKLRLESLDRGLFSRLCAPLSRTPSHRAASDTGDGDEFHRCALASFPSFPPSISPFRNEPRVAERERGTRLRPPLLPFALDGALLWWSSGEARLRRSPASAANHRATRATSPFLFFLLFLWQREREKESVAAPLRPLCPPSHPRRCHPLRRLRLSLAVSAPPSNGLAAVPPFPFFILLLPTPRLTDARPDREERRVLVAALFVGELKALPGEFLCPV